MRRLFLKGDPFFKHSTDFLFRKKYEKKIHGQERDTTCATFPLENHVFRSYQNISLNEAILFVEIFEIF